MYRAENPAPCQGAHQLTSLPSSCLLDWDAQTFGTHHGNGGAVPQSIERKVPQLHGLRIPAQVQERRGAVRPLVEGTL
jgi:hypothetical protein